MEVLLKALRMLTYIFSNSFASVKVNSARLYRWLVIGGTRQGAGSLYIPLQLIYKLNAEICLLPYIIMAIFSST